MIPAGDLDQRLQSFIKATAYRKILPPATVTVTEPEKPGEADVECRIPEGCVCIDWTGSQDLFNFLEGRSKADGAFMIRRPSGEIEAHIMECKRTVDSTKWTAIMHQMRCTLSRLLALTGALGLSLSRVVLYTAFRKDSLSSDAAVDPAAAKRTIRPTEASDAELELDWARKQQLAWEIDEVSLRNFEGTFRHRKIPLDPVTGRGAVVFDLALR